MISKKKLIQHFNKAADSYDQFANVQKHIALSTKEMISNKPNDIMELGSGTGFLTSQLFSFSPVNIDCIDISEKMNHELAKKYNEHHINFITEDIETYIPEKKYDLILSSSTFQWLEDPVKQIHRYRQFLNSSGELIISFFIEHTFKEMREIIERITRRPYESGLIFLPVKEIILELEKNEIKYIIDEKYISQEIQSLESHLKELKMIGANNAGKNTRISRNEWKEIFTYYDQNVVKNKKPYISYHVCYLKVKAK
jgi:malonyl-CoA O-methyltransferase